MLDLTDLTATARLQSIEPADDGLTLKLTTHRGPLDAGKPLAVCITRAEARQWRTALGAALNSPGR